MKSIAILLTLGVAMTLTACQTNATPQPSSISMTKPAQAPMTHAHLIGSWQLMDNDVKGSKHQPLILKFEQNEVLVINGCNNLRATYHIHNGTVQVGSPISTRMMCEKPLMEIDNLAVDLLKGTAVLEKLTNTSSEQIYLKIMTVDGRIYTLKRV